MSKKDSFKQLKDKKNLSDIWTAK